MPLSTCARASALIAWPSSSTAVCTRAPTAVPLLLACSARSRKVAWATPLVWRVQPDLQVRDHIGRDATVHAAWLDQHGYLYLDSDLGFGLVHSQDVGLAADALERGDWPLQELHREDLAKQFAYQKSPTSLNNV